MTTATIRHRPLTALVRAESLQLGRNKTLIVMGTVFPILIPLVTFFAGQKENGITPTLIAITLEMFVLLAILFVQYYSVLSMVTTRRGEGVLKRLRTGEAADWQIQAAPAIPSAVLTLVGSIVLSGVVFGTAGTAPVNPVAILLAVVAGVVLFSLLALATSGVTKNAEAAQVTSLPVMAIAIMGSGSIRQILPDRLAAIADWTPFAAVSDLLSLGAIGAPTTDLGSADVLDFTGTFSEFGRPLATLAIWTAAALLLVHWSFRWDDRG